MSEKRLMAKGKKITNDCPKCDSPNSLYRIIASDFNGIMCMAYECDFRLDSKKEGKEKHHG